IGRYPDGKTLGMRRARGAGPTQAGQPAFAVHDFCICIEGFWEFAMPTDTDMGGVTGEFVHPPLGGPHNELEMRDVITLVGADHEKFMLPGRASVQSVAFVKHEDL